MHKVAVALVASLGLAATLVGISSAAGAPASNAGSPFANGKKNFIIAAGVTRKDATFTFAAVQAEAAGWVVLYRIVDGIPQGEHYAGATFVPAGQSRNVQVKADFTPAKGEHLVVMLHRDSNENKVFDFVFDDAGHVLDEAVKENNRMVARIFPAP